MSPSPEIGTLIAERYEVLGILGEGGQATVYRVLDRNLQLERALKLVSTATVQQVRIDLEVRMMTRLNHPALLRVADVGRHDGRTFLVTPLIEEGSLSARLQRDGPLSEDTVSRWFSDLLDGLTVVHAGSIVHRDIKPPNLLIQNDSLLLADFGIAREAKSIRTMAGAPMGTFEYMAPEQQADASSVTPKADLYSVGASMFNAVTCQSALYLFAAERDADRFATLSPRFRDVIWRATRMEPERRFASATAMAEALRTPDPPADAHPHGPSKSKVCLLGASGVGKTSLVGRFVRSMFSEDYRTTVGVQIERKEVVVHGRSRTCILWDLEGEDRWAKSRLHMMRGAHGFVVVVDGTRGDTALVAKRLLDDAMAVSGPRPYALLLNKADRLSEWTVRADELADLFTHAAAVYRTSAKTGQFVEEAFHSLVSAIR